MVCDSKFQASGSQVNVDSFRLMTQCSMFQGLCFRFIVQGSRTRIKSKKVNSLTFYCKGLIQDSGSAGSGLMLNVHVKRFKAQG